MEYIIKTGAEFGEALKSAKENDILKITGRVSLSDTVILQNRKELTVKGENGSIIDMTVSVGGFKETSVNGKTVWCADIPEDISKMRPYNAFLSDGTALSRPRLPRNGFFTVPDLPERKPGEKINCCDLYEFGFNAGEIPQMVYTETAQVRMFHWWTDDLCYIDRVDYESSVIHLKNPILHTPRCENHPTRGARWYLDNVFEALGYPGEYYITPDCKKLYYVPSGNDCIQDFSLKLSAKEKLLIIDGCENIRFENITFFGSDRDKMDVIRRHSQAASDVPCAIDVINSCKIAVENCRFESIGLSCFGIDKGSNHITVNACEFSDIGGNPVYIKGENLKKEDWVSTYPQKPGTISNAVGEHIMHDIRVTNCHIHGYGKVYYNACGILLKFAYNCDISNNEIHDGVYTGISCGWVWGYAAHATNHIRIEYNHIYDIGKEILSDMGGIYTLGQQEGTVIRGNRVHDIKMFIYGVWGIYLDEGSSDILVERNICYDLFEQPFHQHYGSNNYLRHNVFAFGDGGAIKVTRKEDHLSLILECNIIVSKGTSLYCNELDDLHIAECSNLIWDYCGAPLSGDMVFDAITRSHSFPEGNRRDETAVRAAGLYRRAVISDPLFSDVEARDFSLRHDSPAIPLGFEWLVK